MTVQSRFSLVGWSAYLACSWTWCIGMFLPILLLRDYGWLGYAFFAVPNILGAAAMGFILSSAEHSSRLVQRHTGAMVLFSFVTRAFQFAFALLLTGLVQGQGFWVFFAWLILSALFSTFHKVRTLPMMSILTWIVSFALLTYAGFSSQFSQLGGPTALTNTTTTDLELLGLALVCAFGFVLCPYLDLTFHLARQHTPGRQGPIAFALGFGVLFAAMIAFTAAYAGIMGGEGTLRSTTIPVLIAAHMVIQLTFTSESHGRTMSAALAPWPLSKPWNLLVRTLPLLSLAVGAALMLFGPRFLPSTEPFGSPMEGEEVVYRILLGCYGLLFPAYVWLCMIPLRGTDARPSRRHYFVWLAACAVAAPFFFMGFIQLRETMLLPGLAIVLAARLFIPRSAPGTRGTSGAPVRSPSHPPPLHLVASAAPSDEVPDTRS